ncbi:MAG: hypothetical protein ACFNUJ_07250, partial [Campylobacter curvus]
WLCYNISLIFSFQKQENTNSIPIKTLLASLSPPIFTKLCYARNCKAEAKQVSMIYYKRALNFKPIKASRYSRLKICGSQLPRV